MAIKRKTEITYLSDRGIEMELSEMEDSHLINAITHHKKQIQTLEECPIKTDYIQFRIKLLNETVLALYEEIAQRNPIENNDD